MSVTARKLFKFDWIYKDFTTYVESTDPKIFYRNIPIDQIITINLKDDQYSIDSGSIMVFLNGYDITNAVVISSISGGYRVKYFPTINYAYGQTINIRVRAANINGNYMPDYSYYFITEKRRLKDLIEVALKNIAKNVDWSKVIDDRL